MYKKLKKRLQNRIERDAVKSTLTWHKRKKENGVVVSDEAITEVVYLKRSRLPLVGDWSRIYPPVNEDGSWNLVNLIVGGNKNLIRLLLIAGVIAMALFGFYQIVSGFENILADQCVQSCLNPVQYYSIG